MSSVRRRTSPRKWDAFLLVGFFAAVAAGALWVVFTPVRRGGASLLTAGRPFPAGGRYASDPYVGSQACSECHPREAALHARSGHAVTLRPAARLELARRLDGTTVADPELPGVRWSYQFRDGEFRVERKAADEVERWVIDYAFGSGNHATTFVSMLDPKILEHRLSYYAKTGSLGITPGHDTHPPPPGLTPHGGELPLRISRECFRCHTTQLSAHDDRKIDTQTMIPNVSCERCHGPGRAHVAAARRGAPESELALPFGPDRWTAESLLTLCGSCHRHPSRAQPGRVQPDDPHLVRFQPVGIMQSKCYRESAGAFSCVTCHDPHARVSADRPSYDKVCLSCHDAPGRPSPTADRAHVDGHPCPVSPRARCVECHMPPVDGGQGLVFSDHWIRVRHPGGSSKPPGAPAAP